MASPFGGESACHASEENNACRLCLEEIRDPRLLPCLHTFCCECIEQMAVTAGDTLDIRCPICRVVCRLPDDGATGLPQDSTRLQRNFRHRRSLADPVSEMDVDGVSWIVELCRDHGQALDLFCEVCEVPVCDSCTTVGDHIGHISSPYDQQALLRHRKRVLNNVERLRQDVQPQVEAALGAVEQVGRRLRENAERVRDEIKAATKRAIAIAQTREQELLQSLDDVENSRLKVLEGQQEELKDTCTGVMNTVAFSDRVRSLRDMERSQVRLLSALDKRILALDVAELRPRQHPRILLKTPGDDQLLKNAAENAGELRLCRAAASQCTVTKSRACHHVEQGGGVTFEIQSRDDWGELLRTGGDHISFRWEQKPPGTRRSASVSVTDYNSGQYSVLCQPAERGEHVMALFINNEPVEELLSFSYGNLLDPNECHQHIMLSDNFSRATKVGDKTGYSSVLGRTEMKSPSEYSWIVHLGEGNWYAVGVVAKPVHNKSYNMGQALCWSSQQYVYKVGHAPEKSQLSTWNGGDQLLLEMDCRRGYLRITNLQNGDSDTIHGLHSGPYFPYFNMNVPGSSIFLPE